MEATNSQRASVEDILRADVERTGGDFDETYRVIEEAINAGVMRILRYKNTLAIYRILSKGVAEPHLATMDDPNTLVEALREFMKSFKIAGFKTLHADIDDPQIIRLLKIADYSFTQQQVHADNNQSSYHLIIEVK